MFGNFIKQNVGQFSDLAVKLFGSTTKIRVLKIMTKTQTEEGWER